MKLRHLFLFCVICCSVSISAQNKSKLPKTSGNPIFPGWYADPEGIVFGDGFILPILPLMMIRYSWMLSHQKIW